MISKDGELKENEQKGAMFETIAVSETFLQAIYTTHLPRIARFAVLGSLSC